MPPLPRNPGGTPRARTQATPYGDTALSRSISCLQSRPLVTKKDSHPEPGDAGSSKSLSLRGVKKRKKKKKSQNLCPPSAPRASRGSAGPSCLLRSSQRLPCFLEHLESSICFLPSPCARHQAPPWAQAPTWGRFCVATPPPHVAGDRDLLFSNLCGGKMGVAFFWCLE